MTPKQRWLAATWPQVLDALPEPPAEVLEIGCGELGGFVPQLLEAGYHAVGVDPQAPPGPDFRASRFEDYASPHSVDAVVASTSLHHVDSLDDVIGRIADVLRPGGWLVVIEWAWERFDEVAAQWCFARLTPPLNPGQESWLHRHAQRWTASGLAWDDYWRGWTHEEGLLRSDGLVRGLDQRFDRERFESGPYFFPELERTDVADELAAIAAGTIPASGIRWVGRRL